MKNRTGFLVKSPASSSKMFAINDSMSGVTFDGRYAAGLVNTILPGLGYLVSNDGYSYLLVDKFSSSRKKQMSNFVEDPVESMYTKLSKETILYWLGNHYCTKACIYGKEVKMQYLIDPLSFQGLSLPFKLAPFADPIGMRNVKDVQDFVIDFYCRTGKHYPCGRGDEAPVPYELIVVREEAKQMDQWHLARALKFPVPPGNYTYHFLECGKRLRIELNGVKEKIIHYENRGVVPTPSVSGASSPATPFILSSPSHILYMEEIEGITGVEAEAQGQQTNFTASVKRLSTSDLTDGLEEMAWEMRRIRKKHADYYAQPDFITAQAWCDAAWDEIQERREQEEHIPSN